jgi:hypothetical protein
LFLAGLSLFSPSPFLHGWQRDSDIEPLNIPKRLFPLPAEPTIKNIEYERNVEPANRNVITISTGKCPGLQTQN